MKKLLALFLACTMVLGLASCKEQDEEEKKHPYRRGNGSDHAGPH